MTHLPEPSSDRTGSCWSDAAVDQLKALWGGPGMSAAVIAERLGVSRNAVLGKAHRLGLSTPRTARAPKPVRPPRSRRPSRAPRRSPPARGLPVDCGLEPLVARLEVLPRHACRWPIGDPRADAFGFCGRRAPARVYCDVHWVLGHRAG